MKQSTRRQIPAFMFVFAVVVSAAVAACGEMPTGPEAEAAQGLRGISVAGQQSLTADNVCEDASAPTCTPSGAHAKHSEFACAECHAVAGRLAFQIGGQAYGPGWVSGQVRPAFDATAKTCSNVACHSVPAGVYTYYRYGEARTAPYGGLNQPTPSWYSTGAACTACHGNPPPSNNPTYFYAWHSGRHAGRAITSTYNQCQLCHPDAYGSGGVATGLCAPTATDPSPTNCAGASKHRDGVLDVRYTNLSTCSTCHNGG